MIIPWALLQRASWLRCIAAAATGSIVIILAASVQGESVPPQSKHIIGATATLTEVSTGIPFSARIDTGAKTCSIHVAKIEIEDEAAKRIDNVGKNVRFLLDNSEGEQKWSEATIEAAVRVKSATLSSGVFDRRYKVRLMFEWEGFRKEVLVTLNNRDDMEHPLLIGRNFLRGDFLVDVEKSR